MGSSCGVNKNSPKAVETTANTNVNLAQPVVKTVWKNDQIYIFVYDSNKQNLIMKFNAENEEWETLTTNQQIKIFNYSDALILDDEYILLSGGKQESEEGADKQEVSESKCYLYSMKANLFFVFLGFYTSRFGHSTVNFEGWVYAIGGKTTEENIEAISSTVEKINVSKIKEHYSKINEAVALNTSSIPKGINWVDVEPFNSVRYFANAFLFKREIYLIGGITKNNKICRTIESFSPDNNKWNKINWKMPFGMHSASITGINGSDILIIGGRNNSGLIPSIYQINLIKRRYQSKGAFSYRCLPKLLHFNNDIYIFGGDKEMSCEKLNPVDFVSYAASESYTTFINNDLIKFPGSHITVQIGIGSNVTDNTSNQFKEGFYTEEMFELDHYYLFGTPNHPFILELNSINESTVFHDVGIDFRFYYFGVAIRLNDNFIISLGGTTPPKKKASRSVQALSIKTLSGKKLAKMKTGRCKFDAVAFENCIYVVGGVAFENEAQVFLSSCECYDVKKNIWASMADLPFPICNNALLLLDKHIYTIGGACNNDFLTKILRYSIVENTWSIIEDLEIPDPLLNPSICKLQSGECLILGGDSSEKTSAEILLLDATKKLIKSVGQLNEPRQGAKVFRHGSNLIVLGGSRSDLGVEVVSIEDYSVSINTFKSFDTCLLKCYKDKMLYGIFSA